jgi:hypothetical protein
MVNQLCIGFVPLVNKMIVANGKHGRGNGRLEAISGHDLERCARRVSSCTPIWFERLELNPNAVHQP